MINFLALYVLKHQRAGTAVCVIKEQTHGQSDQELMLSMYLQQGVLNSVKLEKNEVLMGRACCPGSPWHPWGSERCHCLHQSLAGTEGRLDGPEQPVPFSITLLHPNWSPDSPAAPAMPGLSLLPTKIVLLGRDEFKRDWMRQGKSHKGSEWQHTPHSQEECASQSPTWLLPQQDTAWAFALNQQGLTFILTQCTGNSESLLDLQTTVTSSGPWIPQWLYG